MKAIEIANVRKRYKSLQALKGVSLSVEQGEFFGLLGPNGAGKTTLIPILTGLNRVDSGSMHVPDHDVVSDYRTACRKLGVVPRELVFDPFSTVRETLRPQLGYFGLTKNDDWIDEVVANLDLINEADTNMRALPGGMKRRALVVQALVHRPSVIVLDEPTASVDAELRRTLWKLISRLNREGHTVVLTTHCLEEAESLCDHITMLKLGEVVALNRTANLLSQFTGLQLVLSFAKGVLPASLESLRLLGNHGERDVCLRLPGCGEVEQILSTCRPVDCEINDTEVAKADLEDVFVQIMRRESGLPLGPQAPAIPDSTLEPAA